MPNKNVPSKEILSNLFIEIDDLLKNIPKEIGCKKGRKASLSESEVITLIIFGLFMGFKTKVKMWYFFEQYHKKDFPDLPSYKSFNELSNKCSRKVAQILHLLMMLNQEKSEGKLKFIDATPIAVCKNKRIFDHKVADGVAKRGKSSMGWFFGFKLHLCIDEDGNILSCKVTSGNTDDRKPVKQLLKNLSGIVVGDGGYVSKSLQKELKEENNVSFVTGVKRTMKQLMTKDQHDLLKLRQLVETSFGVMKSGQALVSSFARSVLGHFSRILFALLAYQLRSFLPKNFKAIS